MNIYSKFILTRNGKGGFIIKNRSIKSSLILMFISIILISMSVLGFFTYSVSKKALSNLGENALRNKVNMGIAFMKALEKQVQEGKVTREEAQDLFKVQMLNEKQADGKTRGQNNKLELEIGAYMFAINSKGVEMMHPFKEGDDISKSVDPKGNNIVQLITTEGKTNKNNGMIHFYWQNPGETKSKAKTNAVQYFEPWDWYLNAGAYDEDFYKPAKTILKVIFIISIINIIVGVTLFILFLKRKLSPIGDLSKAMKEVSNGNFNIDIKIKSKDEIGEIEEDFINMVQAQKEVVMKIKESSTKVSAQSENLSTISEEMASSSQEVAKTMQQVAEGSSSQATDLQDIVSSISDLANNLESVNKEIESVKNETDNARERADTGKGELEKLIESINEIKGAFQVVEGKVNTLTGSVKEINNFTNAITAISAQTNLLALNAAIEAARAGESGRGFAVVAEEVRKLAEESRKATDEINGLVTSIQTDTEEVIKTTSEVEGYIKSQTNAVGKTVESFNNIMDSVGNIVPLIERTHVGMDKIVKSKDEVVYKVEEVSAVTQENTAASEEVAASSGELSLSSEETAETAQSLNTMAMDLSEIVKQFKVD